MNNTLRVRQFIVDNFFVGDPGKVEEDTSLITEGIVDSTGMLEIIGFLETEFGIEVADAETTPENLETLRRIVAFVERKRASAPGEGR